MSEVAPLISDLAIILIVAGIVTYIFKWLKQPVILGYIIAGVLAGPSTSFLPTISDQANIKIWADIGVIFLLFSMGLGFSFKKLVNVGFTAFIASIIIICGMVFLGYTAGNMMGFSHMNSMFLGGMLSMSSTAIVFKAFNDMGLLEQKFTGVVLGILVVEDLMAVIMMVVLSTLAASNHFEGSAMLESILKLAAFLIFWFALGIYLLPTFMKKVQHFISDEMLLIISLGLCLGMVMIATKAGFSSALGAFVMGSLLAETVEAGKIESVVQPVKDLFAAIFFVSVGMMIDPVVIWEYIIPILILTILVLIGQSCFGTIGVFLSGQPLKVAVQSGFSLTQVGEFAFIIASLGVSLKVTDDYLYPIIVAVSVITTFLTPYMIRLSEPTYGFIERHIPDSLKSYLMRYTSGTVTIRNEGTWYKLLKSMLISVGIYTIICIFFIAMFFTYVHPIVQEKLPGISGSLLSFLIVFAVTSPLMWLIIMKKNNSPEFHRLWEDSKFNRAPLVSLVLVKVIICTMMMMGIVVRIFNIALGAGLVVAVLIIGSIYFSKWIKKRSLMIENRFLSNYEGEQPQQKEAKGKAAHATVPLDNNTPFKELHLADFTIAPESLYVGRTLAETELRKRFQVNVIAIARGDIHIEAPSGKEFLYPYDRITVAGTDEQLKDLRASLEEKVAITSKDTAARNMKIKALSIEHDSGLIGKSILQANISDCIILGLESGSDSTMNPKPETILKENDVVWLIGKPEAIKKLEAEQRAN